ncbi:ATP-binding protein [Maribacter sp. 2-571]|uniref:ATP-binding protein n=1 Tax=Maribacter sp. 2-571 TaxID=3417569 RepID=UPI003D34D6C2
MASKTYRRSTKSSLLLFILLPLGHFLFAQTVTNTTVRSSTLPIHVWHQLEDDQMSILEDVSGELRLKDIETKAFQAFGSLTENLQATYWIKFYLKASSEADTLVVAMMNTDKAQVYIPQKKGYQKTEIGLLSNYTFPIPDKLAKFTLKVPMDQVDFSKPFYLSKFAYTTWSKNHGFRAKIRFMYRNDPDAYLQWISKNTNEDREYLFYLGVVTMSFLLFLAGYVANGSKPFLLYSIYLLTLVIYYFNRLPFVINFWNGLNPDGYYYLNQSLRIATTLTYYIFIYYFLNVPEKFQSLRKLFKVIMYAMLVHGVLYTATIIFFPTFPFRFEMIDYFFLLTTLTSIVLFILMLTKKPDRVAVITLIGSLLITLGGIVAIFSVDALFLLKAVLVETVIFFGVISYQNRVKQNNALQNELELAKEKQEKTALKQLDLVKSRFFENISHEFRTPLTLIKAPITSALQLKETISENDMRMIGNNADRLTTMINDLLSLSKLESGTMRLNLTAQNPKLQLEQLLKQYFSYAQSKDIGFELDLGACNLVAEYDAEILERVTTNLVSNALKFTPTRGKITVTTRLENENLILVVSDNGIGIPLAEQEKIFERFYQVSVKDETRPGSGIGLAMVKEQLNLHKGTILLNSSPDSGSRFTVGLPLKNIRRASEVGTKKSSVAILPSTKNTVPVVTEAPEPKSTSKKPLVLIVEDNPELRSFLSDKLGKTYRTRTAKDGNEGIKKALALLPDIIVSDIMMPHTNGIVLCKTLKSDSRTAHIPIILLTAKSSEKDELIGLGTGADDYITKPFNLQKLQLVMTQRMQLRKLLIQQYKKETLFQLNAEQLVTSEQEFLSKLQKILQLRLTDPSFKVQQLSEEMGMSRMQLNRKINEVIGDTPSNFIRNERLALSQVLLADDKLTVSEVAYSSGFTSPSYFIKCFKDKYGKTPLEYLEKT